MSNLVPRTWKPCTDKDILEEYEKVKQVARDAGYTKSPSLYVTKSSAYYGICRTKSGVSAIAINEKFLQHKEAVTETLIHEYAHSIAVYDCHGDEWMRVANKIGNRFGINAHRTRNPNDAGFSIGNEKIVKYIIKCPDCGATWKRQRKTRIVSEVEHYRCGRCNGHLVLEGER